MTTVLVADDDADYRLMVRLGLDGVPGFEGVLEAPDAGRVAEMIRSEHPDVVLLDVSLPGGFEAVSGAGAPHVVLVSSLPPEELATAAAAAGAVGYIGKDLAPSELPAAITDVTRVVERLHAVLAKASGHLPADLRSAKEARQMVRRTLEGWVDEERVDDVVLCVSELVTNAIVHAGSGPRVLVHVRPIVIHVEISDDCESHPVERGASPEDTSGRGMSILSAFSDRWGSLRRSGGGKTVWFDVSRGPAR